MVAHTLNVLSLCAGVGMLDIAIGLTVEARCVCYVEREAYADGLLATRMADGALDEAPVWSDLTTFDSSSGSIYGACSASGVDVKTQPAATTTPLFGDLPVPAPRVMRRAVYAPCNPAMRTARDFCNAMVDAADPARRAACYASMIAAILAKDGAQ